MTLHRSLTVTLALILSPIGLASPLLADTCTVPDGPGRPINHANLFIEDNAGDGDIGVHGDFDDHGIVLDEKIGVVYRSSSALWYRTPCSSSGLGTAQAEQECKTGHFTFPLRIEPHQKPANHRDCPSDGWRATTFQG